ncbi:MULTISPECIES: hypothetical protein [unclassified Streptomyces]|uniref:hypothetical protein n=1 Tax=unclassified Streptomyces TaxID=2593676 RepID=UPI00344F4BC1
MGELCHCFRDLKMRREAVEQAVDSADPKYVRTLGFCRAVLAQSRLLNGKLEAASAGLGLSSTI